jgi:hypothetical protein
MSEIVNLKELFIPKVGYIFKDIEDDNIILEVVFADDQEIIALIVDNLRRRALWHQWQMNQPEFTQEHLKGRFK